LMDPALRAAMVPDTLSRLSAAIASSLTTVYIVVLILAVISCALCFLIPAGQRTQR
jgi:multisubunit Na+/H+ antiporter MnhG subunit